VRPPRAGGAARLLRAPGDRTRWLAVGDAALAVDPISGSGVVRALRTAVAAAGAARPALDGARDSLAAYDDDRNRECTAYLVERASYYAMERWPGVAVLGAPRRLRGIQLPPRAVGRAAMRGFGDQDPRAPGHNMMPAEKNGLNAADEELCSMPEVPNLAAALA
jgi:2-polyprenyl-6-methoxyphenol hydroxylase-like FAD-dependent oxidoreductase